VQLLNRRVRLLDGVVEKLELFLYVVLHAM
jgi:hypothetical protein